MNIIKLTMWANCQTALRSVMKLESEGKKEWGNGNELGVAGTLPYFQWIATGLLPRDD